MALQNSAKIWELGLSAAQVVRLSPRAQQLTKRDLVALGNVANRLKLSIEDLQSIVDAFGQNDAPADPEVQGDACCCAPCCCCCAVSVGAEVTLA